MSRHFANITLLDLSNKIVEAHNKLSAVDDYYEFVDPTNSLNAAVNLTSYRILTEKIAKDLDKVGFDTENITVLDSWSYEGIGGFNSLNNGLNFLGITAGGDWEYPVYFIIYWNGVSLRGYVPKLGNVWNYRTKTAIGNDEEDDLKFLKKVLKSDYDGEEDILSNAKKLCNPAQIIEDIKHHIIAA